MSTELPHYTQEKRNTCALACLRILRNAIIHNVIPTKITKSFVTLHDPRQQSITRHTIRLFRRAYEGLGGRCVVCWKESADR